MSKREIPARHSSERRSNWLLALVNSILNWIEHLGSRGHRRGRWYHDRYYRRLVEREVKLASLKPGAKILHIGCGPLPMTALDLAGMGFRVEAIDYDSAAVRAARQMVRRRSQDERITVTEADGSDIDCSPFNAVWISLVVGDKRRIVAQVLQTLRPGARVLYRNYCGPLTLLYPRLDPGDLGLECEHHRVTHTLGKETIIVRRKFS